MPTKKPKTARSVSSRPLSEQTIAERAYGLWQARGCPSSDGREDWFAAQAELAREASTPKARGAKTHSTHS